jgi:hypothetical protein
MLLEDRSVKRFGTINTPSGESIDGKLDLNWGKVTLNLLEKYGSIERKQ